MGQKLNYGDVVVHGYAQEMADGTWQSRCCITVHAPDSATDHLLQGKAFKDRQSAVTDGIHMGINWVNENYPTST